MSKVSKEECVRGSKQKGTSAELHKVEMLPALDAARDIPASMAWLSAKDALDMMLNRKSVVFADGDGDERTCR